MKRIVGIIGGMGPLATCDLYEKIINHTKAQCDQEHLRVMIDGNTDIPDRTKAILHNGADPVPALTDSTERLIGAGAEVLCLPCNTAHYFYDRVADRARELNENAVVVNMLLETAKEAKRMGCGKVGLLATDGTVQSRVYKKAFEREGIEVLIPDAEGQKAVMSLIYDGIKAGKLDFDTGSFINVMDELFGSGADTMVLGCTELPVAFSQFGFPHRNIDPTTVLAKAVIREAGGEVK